MHVVLNLVQQSRGIIEVAVRSCEENRLSLVRNIHDQDHNKRNSENKDGKISREIYKEYKTREE